jgi:hypothetical protein
MTERKPLELSFRSWIEQQISEAQERGEFDNLPGYGRPLPKKDEADDGLAWIRDKLSKEGVAADALLPEPLKLRRETERLGETVHLLRTEQEVRAAVADLNARIMKWRRIPLGPPIFVPLADEEDLVARWLAAQPPLPPVKTSGGADATIVDPALGRRVRPTFRRPAWLRVRIRGGQG